MYSFQSKSKLIILFSIVFFNFNTVLGQENFQNNPETNFWQNVNFGGGMGLSFGNGFFMGSISPIAIYNFNPYFSAGLGLSYTHFNDKRNGFRTNAYGGSVIMLYNPIREIQLSAELEGLQVDRKFTFPGGQTTDNFFQEALFLGAGYRINNVTVGMRYNILYDRNRSVYGTAFLPFVRVFF